MDPIEFQQDVRGLDRDLLDQLRAVIATEIERQDNLARIPAQIADLAEKYRDGGGDEQALTDALTPEQEAAINT